MPARPVGGDQGAASPIRRSSPRRSCVAATSSWLPSASGRGGPRGVGASLTDPVEQLRNGRPSSTVRRRPGRWRSRGSRAWSGWPTTSRSGSESSGRPTTGVLYRPVRPESVQPKSRSTKFRAPPEGAQKLLVNLQIITVIMIGRSAARRISERVITSQDDGLASYRTWAFASRSEDQDPTYVPTQALWGCRAQQVNDNGLPMTRLWFPGPLRIGEQAHFVAEAVYEVDDSDSQGWINVQVDHHGIDPGRVCGVLPVSGLTIRIRFDSRCLPSAVWWYAEQDERERYVEPPVGILVASTWSTATSSRRSISHVNRAETTASLTPGFRRRAGRYWKRSPRDR